MSAALDTTAALSRAQAAFANASGAMATLAQTVVDAHRESERDVDARRKALERREREIERMEADLARRLASVEVREEEISKGSAEQAALRRSYRRGYETGYARGRTGRPADVERALNDKRNSLRLAA